MRAARWNVKAAAHRFGDAPLAALLLAPALGILALFSFWPMLAAVRMSLYGGKFGMGPFVGLANYAEALGGRAFWNSALVTLYYALGTIPPGLAISFCVAYALHRTVWGRGLFRTIYFLPYITSAVAAAMVWRALLNPQFGMANALLELAGLPAQQWLLEPRGILHLLSAGAVPPGIGPSLALCCIMAFDVWHGSGLMIVVFLAGLAAVPRELEDAARIDGAGTLRVIRHVVLPLLSPTILFLATVGLIRAFQAFNSVYALTQGSGALGTTENLVMHLYIHFSEYGRWGYGAAVATLLSAGIASAAAVQWRAASRRVHYE